MPFSAPRSAAQSQALDFFQRALQLPVGDFVVFLGPVVMSFATDIVSEGTPEIPLGLGGLCPQ